MEHRVRTESDLTWRSSIHHCQRNARSMKVCWGIYRVSSHPGKISTMTIYLLGLDGASTNTIQETLSRRRLPNFERLMKQGAFADLRSVYPYVTAPAWTTLFSGVNPGKHGIFEMFEIRENKVVPSNMRATDVPFLWDYLTWANKRSLVIGVPFIHPAPK